MIRVRDQDVQAKQEYAPERASPLVGWTVMVITLIVISQSLTIMIRLRIAMKGKGEE